MSCKKCGNDGTIYICNNCGKTAYYDYEFNNVFCDYCEILREEYTVYAINCPECNQAGISEEKEAKEYILFFDTETNGLPKNWDAPLSDTTNWPRLVQLAYQLFDNEGNKLKENDIIIYPDGFEITNESSQIHGITNEKASLFGKPIIEVLSEFLNVIKSSHTIVGHNLDYDINIIGCELIRKNLNNPLNSIKRICTMKSSTNFCAIDGTYGYKWPKLSELHYKLFNSTFEDAHNASVDIEITSKCFWELVNRRVINLGKESKIIEEPLIVPCFIEKDKEKKYGFMNSKTKKIVIKCQFEFTYPFQGNYAKVIRNGNTMYVTINGVLIQPNDNFWENTSFGEGIVPAKASRELNPLSTERICGYIDTESEEIIKIPFEYQDAKEFIDEYALVKKSGKWGIINKNGEFVIPNIYERLIRLKNQLFVVNKSDKWGIIDIEHKDLVPIIYGFHSYSVEEQYLTFSKDGKFGFFDTSSNKLLDLVYQGASQFKEGCVPVKINGKWGYVDSKWNEIIPFEFDNAKSFSEGIAAVKKGNKWGYINKSNDLIRPLVYRTAENFHRGMAQIEFQLNFKQRLMGVINGKYKRVLHKINTSGEVISSWEHIVEYKKAD